MKDEWEIPTIRKCSMCGELKQVDTYCILTKECFCEDCAKKRG